MNERMNKIVDEDTEEPYAASIAERLQTAAANERTEVSTTVLAPIPGPDADRRLRLAEDRRFTCGEWATEQESAQAFDATIGSGLWRVYREVRGVLVHPRPCQMDKTVRIDRVLVPTMDLIALGWTHGAIGVEIKRSGEKIGPPVSQAIDYGRSVWTLSAAGNVRVWLDYVFVWPMQGQGSFVGSIMQQNRVGTAEPTYRGGYRLKTGEASLLDVDHLGTVRVGTGVSGMKAGRR